MSSKKNILYLSYDGLTDQLADSQILPYLDILNNFFNVFILTCEKRENSSKIPKIKNDLEKKSMKYFYLKFSKKFLILTLFRIYDSIKIFFYLIIILKKNKIELIHARGHIPAYVCLIISYFFKIKYTFDFRGLWAEERIDNNSLNVNTTFGILIYKILKFLETKALLRSFQIIVLTKKLKEEFISKYNLSSRKIFVMPCYVNIDFFRKKSQEINLNIYEDLKIPNNSKIICYSGSLGGFYLIDEMLSFFSEIQKNNKNYYFLIITKNTDELNQYLSKIKDKKIKQSIIVKKLEYYQMPVYLSKANLSIFFIKNSKARLGTCPIKFGESLSLGIPIICNTGIGDLTDYFNKFKIGQCVDLNNKDMLRQTVLNLGAIEKLDKKNIIDFASNNLSINIAFNKFKAIYRDVI